MTVLMFSLLSKVMISRPFARFFFCLLQISPKLVYKPKRVGFAGQNIDFSLIDGVKVQSVAKTIHFVDVELTLSLNAHFRLIAQLQ